MSQNPVGTPRRSYLPWILLGLVVAMIASVTLYRQFSATDAPEEASVSGTAERGSDHRRPSPEEIRALARRSPLASGTATARNMTELLEKRKRMTEAAQARIQQRNAAMASRFSAEKSDPVWSGAHERDLASLQDSDPMRDAGVKAENFRAECRSSMCRVQGDFADAGTASTWLQLYMGSVGDRLPVATAHQIRNPDGSVRVEIYGVGRKK